MKKSLRLSWWRNIGTPPSTLIPLSENDLTYSQLRSLGTPVNVQMRLVGAQMRSIK